MASTTGNDEESEFGAEPSADEASERPSRARLEERTALAGVRSMERLRDRIQAAANEITRLRRENALLGARIEALQAEADIIPEGTLISFDEDPETLRASLQGFADAVDDYLSREQPE